MNISQDQESDEHLKTSALIDLSAFEKYLSLKRVLIFMAIVLFLIAWNRGIALMYAMDALIVAILLVGWILPKLNIRNIGIDISLPESANEGDEIPITVVTQKSGLVNRYMIELWGDFPFAPAFALSGQGSGGMKLLPSIGSKTTHTMSVPCDLRGHYTLDTFTLTTGFPLGISTAMKVVKLDQSKTSSSVLIMPTPLPIKHLEFANDPSHSAMQLANNPKVGGHDDYIGIREYRHGDNPRHIHWPSSAKRGEFVVKEFQQNSTTHLSIVLDLNKHSNIGYGKNSTLEYAIKITASLVKYAIDKQYSFTIFGLGKQSIEVSSTGQSPSPELLNNALESLAWIKADGDLSYTQVIQSHLAQSRRGGTIVLFDSKGESVELLPELQSKQYFPVIYQLKADTFSNKNPLPSHPRKIESNSSIIWQVCSGCDLQELFL